LNKLGLQFDCLGHWRNQSPSLAHEYISELGYFLRASGGLLELQFAQFGNEWMSLDPEERKTFGPCGGSSHCGSCEWINY
jgi:hypothetical protein